MQYRSGKNKKISFFSIRLKYPEILLSVMKATQRKLLIVIFALFLCSSPVLGISTLTFRDRSPVSGHQAFIVYQVNSNNTAQIGVLNTTSDQLVLDQDSSYILQFTTQNTDYFTNPSLIVADFWGYMQGSYAGWIAIGFIFFLFCIALAIAFR